MNKPKRHLDVFKTSAKKLRLNVKTYKQGGFFSYALKISNKKKTWVIAPTQTGFYPNTTRWFTTVANSKILSQQVLKDMGFKTISSVFFDVNNDDMESFRLKITKHKSFPALVKPEEGNKGRGILIVNNQKELLQYSLSLFKDNRSFMVQKIIFGTEYRVLLISGKVYVIHTKEFPHVLGDGKSKISHLLKNVTDPIDKNFLKSFLTKNKLTLSSVAAAGYKVPYNITRKGSVKIYKKEDIPQPVINWVKNLASQFSVDTVGVDVFLPKNLKDTSKYKIIEINASPGFTYLGSRYKETKLVEEICTDVLKQYFLMK